jgi:methionine synthase I (cobalamin-dependent)/5,10-methylenetetrahydrofolate reductase
MRQSSFLEEVDRRVLVCDGAMGTQLYAKGVFINRCFEQLNITHPDLVRSVHQEYLRAGADVLESNTFGANRIKLRAFGLSDQVHEINLAGARLARDVAHADAYVAGAIGPLGVRVEPWGKTGIDEAEGYFKEQVDALIEGGVDCFMLETFRDLNEIGAAIAAIRKACDLPIIAQMTTEDDGNSLDGTPPEQFAPILLEHGAHIVGVNCSVGPAPMLETIERLSAVTTAKLSAQPNAGKPRDIEGRNIYLSSPEYMASYARRFIASGVRIVGGCCGTTPEHIRQISAAVRRMTPELVRSSGRAQASVAAVAEAPHAQRPIAKSNKSAFAKALAAGKNVVSVELVPPRGLACAEAIADAKALAGCDVDVITIFDGPRGARMSAMAMAVLIQQHAGIETTLQYSCRDKNLLGIQSDLLGAAAMGIRNILGITGDASLLGDIPDATAVFDVDSIGLTNLMTRLNHGLDVGGQPIGAPTPLHVGVMVDPGSRDLERELKRFEYKVEAGAEFAVTSPVFDIDLFERFLRRVEHLRIPVIVGVWPFETAGNAEFMANEVPGVTVPEHVLARMRAATSDAAAEAEGIRIARELRQTLGPMAQGVHLSSPSGRTTAALAVLQE